MSEINFKACWERAQEKGKRKAEAMWPPQMVTERLRAGYKYSLEFYRQMVQHYGGKQP